MSDAFILMKIEIQSIICNLHKQKSSTS